MTTMRRLIDELPDQLRWAAGVEVPDVAPASEALVAGMGGSGIAGAVAAVVAEAEGRRVGLHRGYGLPGWGRGFEGLVVAVSHSGNTEETLSAFDEALAHGLPVAATATGGALRDRAASAGVPFLAAPPGPQPRAAMGCLTGAVLRILHRAGVIADPRPGLLEAADVVTGVLSGDGQAVAGRIADALVDRAAIVYGGEGITAVAANRWKTQINENAKAPAWYSLLPELDHNEIVGWTAFPALAASGLGVVVLSDRGDHPRVVRRAELTAELIAPSVPVVATVTSSGEGVLARLFSLVVVGDLVSVALADRAGVDPMPVRVIEDLKQRLAEDTP